jgi:hypothetical protein
MYAMASANNSRIGYRLQTLPDLKTTFAAIARIDQRYRYLAYPSAWRALAEGDEQLFDFLISSLRLKLDGTRIVKVGDPARQSEGVCAPYHKISIPNVLDTASYDNMHAFRHRFPRHRRLSTRHWSRSYVSALSVARLPQADPGADTRRGIDREMPETCLVQCLPEYRLSAWS